MRIFISIYEALREVERDLWEMGIDVHPQTMQDKKVGNNPDFMTKEVTGYGFKITGHIWTGAEEKKVISYLMPKKEIESVLNYIRQEHIERTHEQIVNPGISHTWRPNLWNEFLHHGKFAYTYSERIAPQLATIIKELKTKPETRQAIITIHSNIVPLRGIWKDPVKPSDDLNNRGGKGRVPCSMYYQAMIRDGKLDLIYTMRSCDFLTHFPIDICLAIRMQDLLACACTKGEMGTFTYFAGSLHAYHKDMKIREIF